MPPAQAPPLPYTVSDMIDMSNKREIGHLATWSVSSHKPGYGVDKLIDQSLETTWQSEGPQPHLISIQFSRRMSVMSISIFVNVEYDDSYTPSKLSIRAGTFHGDLQEVRMVDLIRPKGWVDIQLALEEGEGASIRANLVQIAVLSNHLNGKDTHIRSVRVFAPNEPNERGAPLDDGAFPFTSSTFRMHSTIR